MRCSHVAQRATDYTEGALGPIAHWRTRRHVNGCDPCRTYIAQLQLTARALPRLVAEPPAASQQAAALAVFRQWQAERPGSELAAIASARSTPGFSGVVIVTGLAVALSVAFARHPAPFGRAWLIALLLAGTACGLMLLARRHALRATLLATLAATAPVLAANPGPLALSTGAWCVVHELLTAAVPLVALVLWHRTRGMSRAGLVGIAATGALAGDAALHVSCSQVDSILHLLIFHVGGVAVAAALAGLVAGRLLRLGSATA